LSSWESLTEFRSEVAEMFAEAVTHCVFAQLGMMRVAQTLQDASAHYLGMALPSASSAQRQQWQSPCLLHIFDAYSIPQSLRSDYLRNCGRATAIGQATPTATLVSELVHDQYYPSVQAVAQLMQCLSPLQVYACCGTIVRTVTALAPATLGADDLIPLVSCALHMGLCLGRAAREDTTGSPTMQYFLSYPDRAAPLLALLKTSELFVPEHMQIREEAYALTVMLTALTTLKPM
jgi:hypothetical protein